jgi:hypothetical protein
MQKKGRHAFFRILAAEHDKMPLHRRKLIGEYREYAPDHAGLRSREAIDLIARIGDQHDFGHRFGREAVFDAIHDPEKISLQQEIGDLTAAVLRMFAQPHHAADDLVGVTA